LEIVYRLSAPYGARKGQIEIAQQTDTSAKRKISKRKTVRQQTDQRRTANISKSANSSKISEINDNEGRLPAGGTRPRNTHCMIMLPT
jgi:hypothetical protein